MNTIFQFLNAEKLGRTIIKAALYLAALVAICLVLVASQRQLKSNTNSNANRESSFLSQISEVNGLNKLLEASAHTKLDSIYVEADEHVADQNGRVFLTRRFDVELVSVDYNLVDQLKAEVERRLGANKLQIDQNHSYPTGFNIDYSSTCLIGTMDLRSVHDSGEMFKSKNNTYRLFFVFHESFCK